MSGAPPASLERLGLPNNAVVMSTGGSVLTLSLTLLLLGAQAR